MKANSISTSGSSIIVVVLGILAALIVFAVLTGRKLPLISTDRAALFVLVGIGMIMCMAGGIGPVSANKEWLHPLSIISYLLGAGILVIGIAALFGKNISPLTSIHQSFIAVATIAAVKLVLTTIHRLLL